MSCILHGTEYGKSTIWSCSKASQQVITCCCLHGFVRLDCCCKPWSAQSPQNIAWARAECAACALSYIRHSFQQGCTCHHDCNCRPSPVGPAIHSHQRVLKLPLDPLPRRGLCSRHHPRPSPAHATQLSRPLLVRSLPQHLQPGILSVLHSIHSIRTACQACAVLQGLLREWARMGIACPC